MQLLVSIIIPTFNRAYLLNDTLQSVCMETYENWECIVVDDGSTDNTAQIIEQFISKDNRFKYHKRPENYKAGGNGARNYGFEVSKGEYINWFDDDDIMLPHFLKDKIEVFKNELVLVISSGYYWNPKNNEKVIIDLAIKNTLYQDYTLWQTHILTPSILFRKHFLQGKDLFSDKVLRGQETELFSRLFFQLPTSRFFIVNKPSFLYRQHEVTKSFQNKVYKSEFAKSRVYINIEGFKRSVMLDNKLLLRYAYRGILKSLFLSIKNHDTDNVEYVLNNFSPVLIRYNRFVNYQFNVLGKLASKSKIFYEFSIRYLWRLI